MAHIYQTFRTRINPETGKREPVTNAKGEQVPHKNWRAEIILWTGKRKSVTLSHNKAEAQRQADRLQVVEDEIRQGLRPPPTKADKAAKRLFDEVAGEYLEWGRVQGGRNGRPWGEHHLRHRRDDMTFWKAELGLEVVGDLLNCLPKVEKMIRRRLDEGKTGKTVANIVESLRSFIIWAKTRKYLDFNPLEGLGRIDTTPKIMRQIRRAHV